VIINYTTDRASRSYRVGHGLARSLKYGAVVTLLAFVAKALGAPLPLWLVLLPTAVPLGLVVAVFAFLGVIISLAFVLGGDK
jgi:hypothetical protein